MGDRKLFKIILVGVLKNFLIHRVASQIVDGVLQNSQIISTLAAENNIPQYKPERQSDEEPRLDGTEGQ